ncbi:MAG: hypothetical protein HC924_15960 [Synechococcaceae cyanobacterium SM2_3_2]|nr:hypothetical protein [Synechococcaceae cyanobacterium SM2_3_2]
MARKTYYLKVNDAVYVQFQGNSEIYGEEGDNIITELDVSDELPEEGDVYRGLVNFPHVRFNATLVDDDDQPAGNCTLICGPAKVSDAIANLKNQILPMVREKSPS